MAILAAAMSIEHCFDHGTVIFELPSVDKFDALRERLQSTGLGHGVAVAHGRAAGVQRVLIALGPSREGIPYTSSDEEVERRIRDAFLNGLARSADPVMGRPARGAAR